MHRQPGIDTGGLRQQFFSVVLGDIAFSHSVQVLMVLFISSVHPLGLAIFRQACFLQIGTMIRHCLVMDGYGFPYLSEYCYYYIVGYEDMALTCITLDDVGEQVKRLVTFKEYNI